MSGRRRWVGTGDGAADAVADARRARIVDVTWRLIGTIGLERTTMRRIAEQADCTTGLVTHYFASKEEVLLAALQRITHEANLRLRTGSDPGLARLRHAAEAVLPVDEARAIEWRVWLAFWGRAYSDPELMAQQRQRYIRWRDVIRRGLEEAVENVEISSGVDREYEVTRLVGLLMGLSVDAVNLGTAGDGANLMTTIDRHLDSLRLVSRS